MFRLHPNALPFAVTPAFHKKRSTIETNSNAHAYFHSRRKTRQTVYSI
jgi:hypothetical protein